MIKMINLFLISALLASALAGYIYYERDCSGLDPEGSAGINFTSLNHNGLCFYEGLRYGCNRNITKLLIERNKEVN